MAEAHAADFCPANTICCGDWCCPSDGYTCVNGQCVSKCLSVTIRRAKVDVQAGTQQAKPKRRLA